MWPAGQRSGWPGGPACGWCLPYAPAGRDAGSGPQDQSRITVTLRWGERGGSSIARSVPRATAERGSPARWVSAPKGSQEPRGLLSDLLREEAASQWATRPPAELTRPGSALRATPGRLGGSRGCPSSWKRDPLRPRLCRVEVLRWASCFPDVWAAWGGGVLGSPQGAQHVLAPVLSPLLRQTGGPGCSLPHRPGAPQKEPGPCLRHCAHSQRRTKTPAAN